MANQEAGFIEFPNKEINRRLAIASSFGAVALFFSSRLDFGVSLKDLAANAVPYEEVGFFHNILVILSLYVMNCTFEILSCT